MTARSALFAATLLIGSSLSGQVGPPNLPIPKTSVIDAAGNAYSIGFSFPATPGAAQTKPGGGTCTVSSFPFGAIEEPCPFVNIAKTDSSGNVIFSTLLGGQRADFARGIAIDAAGFTYVVGESGGLLPTTPNAAVPTSSSGGSFAARLSADGSQFVYVTYLPSTMFATAVAADASGNAYVTGSTQDGHALVLKISPDGSAFPYNVKLAGSQFDFGLAIATDAAGNPVVTGTTNSFDFPKTNGAVQTRLNGKLNLFVTRLDAAGNIAASTLLGGGGTDQPNAIQVDSSGNVYVAGATDSLDFPTTAGTFEPAAIIPPWSGGPGGFLSRLSRDFSSIIYSTYVASTPLTQGFPSGLTRIAVGTSGDVYVSGVTRAGFPVTRSAPSPCYASIDGGGESFVAHLSSTGALADATYSGGSQLAGLGALPDGFLLTDFIAANAKPAFSRIRFGDPPGACLSAAALNSASLIEGQISPGEFITLTGLGIGPENGVGLTPDALGRPPVSLGGVQVLFDGQAAPLLYAQSNQINVLAPFELSGKPSTSITVVFGANTFGPIEVPVVPRNIGIFRRAPGVSADAGAVNQDGTLNTSANPAARGSIVSLWGTGFGQTPGCATGAFNALTAVPLVDELGQTLGGQPASLIDYAGSAPTFLCGVEQINIRIPLNAQAGTYFVDPIGSKIYLK